MASVGWVRLAAARLRNRQRQKLQIRQEPCSSREMLPTDNEIVNSGIYGEVTEAQRHHVVAVGRGPTKLEIEHHVASGDDQHRTWCDACMRARGIDGRHERREPGVEDEIPFVRIDHGYLELDVTETDDDDEDDAVAQNKLLILDLKAGTFATTCLRVRERERSESMPRHGWCLCCVDLGIAERYCKVMESKRS